MLYFKHVCLDNTAPVKLLVSMYNSPVWKQHRFCEARDSKPNIIATFPEHLQYARNFIHMHTYLHR